ncbi:MAG TPA: hypothetical protein VI217_01005, partial [Mycobacterium sp.]
AVVVIGIEPNWTHRSVGELVGLSQLVLLKDEVQELWARFDDSGRESFEREMLPDGYPGA